MDRAKEMQKYRIKETKTVTKKIYSYDFYKFSELVNSVEDFIKEYNAIDGSIDLEMESDYGDDRAVFCVSVDVKKTPEEIDLEISQRKEQDEKNLEHIKKEYARLKKMFEGDEK